VQLPQPPDSCLLIPATNGNSYMCIAPTAQFSDTDGQLQCTVYTIVYHLSIAMMTSSFQRSTYVRQKYINFIMMQHLVLQTKYKKLQVVLHTGTTYSIIFQVQRSRYLSPYHCLNHCQHCCLTLSLSVDVFRPCEVSCYTHTVMHCCRSTNAGT